MYFIWVITVLCISMLMLGYQQLQLTIGLCIVWESFRNCLVSKLRYIRGTHHWTQHLGRGRGQHRGLTAVPGCSRWCGAWAASDDSSARIDRTRWRPRGVAVGARPSRVGEPPRGPYPSRLAAWLFGGVGRRGAMGRGGAGQSQREGASPWRPVVAEGCGNAIMEATEQELLVLCLLKAHIRLMPGSIRNEKMKWGAVTTAVYYRVSPVACCCLSWRLIPCGLASSSRLIKLFTSQSNYQVGLAHCWLLPFHIRTPLNIY